MSNVIYGEGDFEGNDGYIVTSKKKGLKIWHCGDDTESIVINWDNLVRYIPSKNMESELNFRKGIIENGYKMK